MPGASDGRGPRAGASPPHNRRAWTRAQSAITTSPSPVRAAPPSAAAAFFRGVVHVSFLSRRQAAAASSPASPSADAVTSRARRGS